MIALANKYIGKYYNQLDDYEKYNVARIDQIL